MSKTDKPKFVIIGGGPGGSLMACYLGKAGYDVDVYELREDLRGGNIPGGKSINLALSHRGITALERVGVIEDVMKMSVPMPGRMIHGRDGSLTFQPYGRDDSQAIHSVSRGDLNTLLLDAADKYQNVRLHFNAKCTGVDLDACEATIEDTTTGVSKNVSGDVLVSADGAFSGIRRAMQKVNRFDFSQTYLKHGFKELTIPVAEGGGFRLEKNALHIWPRRSFMMIALPNEDGSFTVTIFWPFEGAQSFEAIKTESDVARFFNEQFPDAVPHMPTLAADYFENPTGSLVTVRSAPWYYKDKVVLLGDACHAVVPFYGQGMNAAFEDALVLDECLAASPNDLGRAFVEYDRIRRVHVNVLADLAISNFVEMRDHTGSKKFLLKKKKEKLLNKLFPNWYLPLYSMATFTRIPYGEAVARAKRQDRIVNVVAGILLLIVVGAVACWLS
jgi:kynurenine 3-monooxygenase